MRDWVGGGVHNRGLMCEWVGGGQAVLSSVSDTNYKISAVSLRVCARITTSVHPLHSTG